MELGLCFDDEHFETKEIKKKIRKQQQPYNVKVCEKGWPFNCPPSNDAVQRQNITKFQADSWYRDGQYDKALEAYTSIHTNPQVASTTVERDVTESVIRCHLKLENWDAALGLLSNLIKKQSEDTSLLLLLAKICSATGNVQSEICCYKKCTLLHSYNHNFWYSLALAYGKVHNSSCEQNSGNNHDNKHLNELIDTLLQSSMTPNHRDCLKLCLNCIHCKCAQGQVLVDKAFLSINHPYHQHNHYTAVDNLNEMTEKLTIEKDTKISSSPGCGSKSCFLSNDRSSSQVKTKSLNSCSTDGKEPCVTDGKEPCVTDGKEPCVTDGKEPCVTDEEPCVTVGINSEDSGDDKSCDFNMTIQHSDSKAQQAKEISSADRYNAMSLFTFFCLLRTRFLLQRAIWTSSSFVKEKLVETMSEVNEQITRCVLCQCGELKKCILKEIESDDVNLVEQQIDDLDMHTLYQGGSKMHWT